MSPMTTPFWPSRVQLAEEILAQVTEIDLSQIRYYRFELADIAGHQAIVSRTGYTGEDGFELYLSPASAPAVWDRLLEAGRAARADSGGSRSAGHLATRSRHGSLWSRDR